MSNHREKFIKEIPLPNGDVLKRTALGGSWEMHAIGRAARPISQGQATIVDAVIMATLKFINE